MSPDTPAHTHTFLHQTTPDGVTGGAGASLSSHWDICTLSGHRTEKILTYVLSIFSLG